MLSALLRFAGELLLGRAVSLQHCLLARSSLHPRSPAQLRSRGPAQGITFSAPSGLPGDVPGAPELTAPERQQSHPWGMDFLADCSNYQLSLSKEWRETDCKSMVCLTRAWMSMRDVNVPLWTLIFLTHNKKDTQAVRGRCWLNPVPDRDSAEAMQASHPQLEALGMKQDSAPPM